MTDIPDYNIATNKAYEILYKYCESIPLIEMPELINQFDNIIMKPYSQVAKRFNIELDEYIQNYASSEYGFTQCNF